MINKEKLQKSLENIYLDYFERLLKFRLNNLYKEYNIPIQEWSEILLDAQWKNASEEDYKEKRKQLIEENQIETD